VRSAQAPWSAEMHWKGMEVFRLVCELRGSVHKYWMQRRDFLETGSEVGAEERQQSCCRPIPSLLMSFER
jgi:hypothetical protein